MSEFVLYKNEVYELFRRDHFGDPDIWLLRTIELLAKPFWVPAKDCTLLDPALNVLFEEEKKWPK